MLALRSFAKRSILILNLLCAVALLAGCQGAALPVVGENPPPQAQAPQTALAEITFVTQLPAKLADDQNLFIEFVDEVTGLAINPARARMETQDHQTFAIKIPWLVGSVLKYRYVRDQDPVGYEYTSLDQPVRYRMYAVEGPGTVRDTVTAWKGTPTTAGLGRIQGQVANKSNNAPVVNALVTAGGMQTLTSSDGSFLLEGLSPGVHNLVAYSLDGSFRTFQQGAVVAAESTTPAVVLLNQSKIVNVTFTAQLPKDSLSGMPVRLIGNIYPLGNTFANLQGGMNVLASRTPIMAVLQDGRYSLTLRLPVGLDLRYKYTLGDGFWNAERAGDGNWRTRQLIVPDKDTRVDDTIDSWKAGDLAPVSFSVTVPADTPASDAISIQFNPFGWTEPIPMWPVGNNRWVYRLYGPFSLVNSASYRYCRNDQCGFGETDPAGGAPAQGIPFTVQSTEQSFNDTIDSWPWSQAASEPVIIPGSEIKARDASFLAGAELMTGYRPSWQPYTNLAFQNIKDIGSNSVMLTPTWHLSHKSPPVIEPVTGQDPLWLDLSQMATQAQQKGLAVTIHPNLRYPEAPATWWQTAPRDEGWWQSWFDRYSTFLLYHADLATQTGAKVLVIGDENLLPALPGGTLADGTPSGVPANAEERWTKLISDVRARYNGKLAWMVAYSGTAPLAPVFLSSVDFVYVQLTPPVIKANEASQADLVASVNTILDTDILKLQETVNHPILLGLQYPSARGALDGCVESQGQCLPFSAFQQPAPAYADTELSLQEQAAVYSAVLSGVNDRSWIAGFFASGYYPVVPLRDLSVSPRNKPASDVLWYWFPRLLGQVKP